MKTGVSLLILTISYCAIIQSVTSQDEETAAVSKESWLKNNPLNETAYKNGFGKGLLDTRKLCDKNWYYFNNYCYWWSGRSQYGKYLEANWFKAELSCRAMGCHLASILSEEESKMLQAITMCHTASWIGLVLTNKKLFKTRDGWSWWDGQPMKYDNFHNVFDLNKQCRYAAPNRLWRQHDCAGEIAWVCKKESKEAMKLGRDLSMSGRTFKAGLMAPNNLSKRCPGNWTYYEGQCYRFFNYEASFLHAELACKDGNAVLASIHSDQQQTFMTAQFECGVRFWIGIQRVQPCVMYPKSTCWEWLDRSPVSYENWHDKFALDKNTECAYSHGFWYNNEPCETKKYFVCQKTPKQEDRTIDEVEGTEGMESRKE